MVTEMCCIYQKSCIGQKCKILCAYVQELSACRLGALPKSLFELCPWTTLGDCRPLVHVAPLAALSGSECLWFSLRLWFSNDVCSSPNSLEDHEPESGSWFSRSLALCRLPKARIHGWVTLTKIFILICLYCLKCTKFYQLILKKILKLLPPDVRF